MSPSDLASQLEARAAEESDDGMMSLNESVSASGRARVYRNVAKLVREHLVFKWSRTLPTVPGHYWVRLRQGEFETVARVYQHKDELVVWTVAGGSAGTPVTAYSGWEWSRAVPEPTNPSPSP